ncbi:MAG: hypothetical protein V1722_01220 [Candidatus Micrarchaeota archaeon]
MARVVLVLKPEEHMFKESLTEIGMKFLEKLEKTVTLSSDDELHLQVKAHVEGKKKRYEVKARMTVKGNVYTADETDNKERKDEWDLSQTTHEALGKLKTVIEKHAKHRQLKGLTEEEAIEKRGMECC